MRILFTVGFYEPHKGGSEEVVRQLAERLAAKGHNVTVATSFDPKRSWAKLNGVEIRSFRVSGNSTLGIAGDAAGYADFLRNFHPDVMLNYAAQIWTTDLAFDVLDELDCAKVMVPCGYILNSPTYSSYYMELPRHLKKYDALIYMSPNYQDKVFGDDVGVGEKAVIIPNGAAAEEFDRVNPSFREKYGIWTKYMLLTVSNHHTLKGHRHILAAYKRLKRQDVTLVIVGDRVGHLWQGCFLQCTLRAMFDPKVKILEGVPRNYVVAAFQEADVFLLASEIECAPLVIYEAMAAGTAFVSTNCGNVSDNSEYGIVVDNVDQIAPALEVLLRDTGKVALLGQKGRAKWREQYTWSTIADSYDGLFNDLVSQRKA